MTSAHVAVIAGTRPEAIKLAPVIHALRGAGLRTRVVASGQHRELLHEAFQAFGLSADVDLAVMRDNQDLPGLTARLIDGVAGELSRERPRFVLVQGDTTTTLAGSLCAFYADLPCGHVEAGLRSGDRRAPWPEEMNRILADSLCTRYYPPTEAAAGNLRAQGIDASAIVVTGQTGVDAALLMAERLSGSIPGELRGLPGLGALRLVYATGHRRESFDGGLAGVAAALRALVEERDDLLVVYPAHPNPNVARELASVAGSHPRLHIIPAVSYAASIWLMSRAAVVVSDSGGIQEEAPSFGVPVVVTRDVTERPEGIAAGFLRIVGTRTDRVLQEVTSVLDDAGLRSRLEAVPNPYGDGRASQRIAADVAAVLAGRRNDGA
ncbi:MAG TPA: UDP-N-acetylglucosamine 2-epimerase (non-hydrolyzing) [Candidatus Polarisedimenticolia bacterium]|nr:UDP-N-acetylglucosamine 2-epimerase (non-hydrolyzing) [Candidatus Polarisedimenticolia bacterium]